MGLIYLEVGEGAFGLGAPIFVRGNLDLAKSVAFCSGCLQRMLVKANWKDGRTCHHSDCRD